MAYKPKPIKTTVSGALQDAFSEISALAEEMREAEGNMSGANMEHMPKYEVISTAADELENHTECPDIPDGLADLEVTSVEMVNKDKRKGPSRDVRLSNACALISDAKAVLEEFDPEADLETSDSDAKVDEKEDAAEALKEAATELANELDEHAEIDVEFPGMYG